MKHRAFLWLLTVLSAAAYGQTVQTGLVGGLREEDKAPWLRWMDFEAGPLRASSLEGSILAGSFIVEWEPFYPRWFEGGWKLTTPDSSTTVSSGLLNLNVIEGQWSANPFEVRFSKATKFSIEHTWHSWVVGGLALQFNGAVWSPAPFKFGPLGAEAWVVWAGLDGTRVFYGEGMAEANLFHNAIFWWLDAKGRLDLRWGGVSAEGLVPLIFANLEWRLGGFYLEGVATLDLLRGVLLQGVWTVDETSRLRAGVFWVDQTWRRGGWSWGLDVGAAVFTVENPTWSQVHRWTEWKFLPPPLPLPVFVEKSSQTDYTLRTSPGWVTVIHPRLTGTLVPGLTWEISRWIPWVSGTTFSITEPGQSAPAGDKAGQPPGTVDAWNLWLAGTQIQLKGQW